MEPDDVCNHHPGESAMCVKSDNTIHANFTDAAPQSVLDGVPYAFGGKLVRSVFINGFTWFVADDVARALDYESARSAIRYLDADEVAKAFIETEGGPQTMLIVSESGIYHLTFKSTKRKAKDFRRWVTHEVLPQIRRTGSYGKSGMRSDHDKPAMTGEQEELLSCLSHPGPHMVFVMPGQKPYIEEVDPREFIRNLDRHDVEGLAHAMNLIGSVWSICCKIDGAIYGSAVLQSGVGRQLDDAIRIGLNISRCVVTAIREKT